MKISKKILPREQEITNDFLVALDNHLHDIVCGKVDEMFEIRDFAALLHIHPTHFSNTIKSATGKSPCYFIEARLIEISQSMLQQPNIRISEIARTLTYDPSNFTKFFKHFVGQTPKKYREGYLSNKIKELSL